MNKMKVPAFHEMMRELFQAVKELGGSGSVNELNDKTIEILDLPQDVQEVMHGSTGRTEVEYRLAWARTYMKKYGILENSERGIWALTSKGSDLKEINPGEIVSAVRAMTALKSRNAAQINLKAIPHRTAARQAMPFPPSALSNFLTCNQQACEICKRI